MRLDGTFLRSKLARRVFFAFVACALVPIIALAWLSFRTVSGQVGEQATARLRQEARATVNGIFERLETLEAQLTLFDAVPGEPSGSSSLAPQLRNVWITGGSDGTRTVRGTGEPPALTVEQRRHLALGRTLLAVLPGAWPRILIARAADPGDLDVGILIADVEPLYVWQGREGTLPPEAELCVFGAAREALYCSSGIAEHATSLGLALAERFPDRGERTDPAQRVDAGELDVVVGTTRYLATYRTISTAFRFLLPELTVAIARPHALVVAPLSSFNIWFAGVVLLSLWVVLLLSSVQIRRSLEPVAALQEGTRRLAARDFEARVSVATGDEFEQLGVSFNSMAEQIGALVDELGLLNDGTLKALARTVDAKSSWTAGHSERVTEMAVRIGKAMQLPDDELELLYQGGLLHDIGKIGVPAAILDKPDRLTDEEFEVMRSHPRQGQRILDPIPGYAGVIPVVLQHHERFAGGGYPDGVAGEDIDLKARILAVADVFDAMSTDRPYRKGMERSVVIETIRKDAGTHFDPNVVDAFLALAADGGLP